MIDVNETEGTETEETTVTDGMNETGLETTGETGRIEEETNGRGTEMKKEATDTEMIEGTEGIDTEATAETETETETEREALVLPKVCSFFLWLNGCA